MNIMELFAHIGLKADTPAAEAFNKSIGNIKGQLVGAIAGTLSLAAAVKAVNDQFNQSLAMQKFADDTGQSVEEMQKWKAVAQQVSGAGATVAESIKAISSNQAKIRLGQGNISGYQLLGIDSRSDPFEVLEALRTKTQGLSQSMRRNIASQFGISNDLVKTLELTNEEFDKLAANAFVIPQGNIDAMNKARSSLETVKNAVNFLVAEFVTALAPSIEAVSKKIAEFVRNHGAKLIEWIQYAIRTITRVADLVDKTIQKTVGWKNALLALAIVFFHLNSAIMLPVAAIALLFIALEDIAAYSRGEDSLIGRYLKGMPAFKKVFDDLLDTFDLVAEALHGLMTGDWTNFDRLVEKWGLFGSYLLLAKDSILGIKEAIGMVTADTEEKRAGHETNLRKTNVTLLDTFERAITGLLGDKAGGAVLSVAGTGMLKDMMKPKAETSAPVTVNNSPTININGAASPEITGRYAAEAIARENQKAFDRLSGEKKEK